MFCLITLIFGLTAANPAHGDSLFSSPQTADLGGDIAWNSLLGYFYRGYEPFLYCYESEEWLWVTGVSESGGYYFWRFAAQHWGWATSDYYPNYVTFPQNIWRPYRVPDKLNAIEYNAIRNTYAEFDLPSDMTQINIIEIPPQSLSVANLKTAIAASGDTSLPDLIIARTTTALNKITYTSEEDELHWDIPSETKGAVSLVGFGDAPLTLDAAGHSRLMTFLSWSWSTAVVNLGGLTLTGGMTLVNDEGGAILQSGGRLTLVHVTMTANKSPYNHGGAMYVKDGDTTLRNVLLSNNEADDNGGACYFVTQSGSTAGQTVMTDVTVNNNKASLGGGICHIGGAMTLTKVTIHDNSARNHGGGVYKSVGTMKMDGVTVNGNRVDFGLGGGIYLENASSSLADVTLSDNRAFDYGGGLYQFAGDATIKNSRIMRNSASQNSGGGICQSSGSSTLTNVMIIGNTSRGGGTGINQINGTTTLTNVAILGNTGDGMSLSEVTATLINTTISGNGGVGIHFMKYIGSIGLTLRNTIVAQNGLWDIVCGDGSQLPTGENNLIGRAATWPLLANGNNGNLVGNGITIIDPLFVDVSSEDHTKWDLRLQATSPARNAGSNALIPDSLVTDLAGHERIAEGTVDMGAYEF